jgi:hypothetical protein
LHKNCALSSVTQKFMTGLLPKFLEPHRIKNQISSVVYELASKNGKTLGCCQVKDLNPCYTKSDLRVLQQWL